jgi:hypothetical protein
MAARYQYNPRMENSKITAEQCPELIMGHESCGRYISYPIGEVATKIARP